MLRSPTMDAGLEQRLLAVRAYFKQPIHELLPPSLLLYLVPPLPSWQWVLAFLLLSTTLLIRVYAVLPRPATANKATSASKKGTATVAVFLGSGGHTTELLQLVSALPIQRYSQRIYMLSSGDQFSLRKAQEFELAYPNRHGLISPLKIPRARRVHQSLLTTPFTLLQSILFCVYHIAIRPLFKALALKGTCQGAVFADVIMMNGPGTCVPIVAAVYLSRILGLSSPKLIYVESFARVKSLSLTAKLVRPFVDRFVLQWPPTHTAKQGKGNDIHSGWLI